MIQIIFRIALKLFAYLAVAAFISLVSLGLLNTYMGTESPVKAVIDQLFQMAPRLAAVERKLIEALPSGQALRLDSPKLPVMRASPNSNRPQQSYGHSVSGQQEFFCNTASAQQIEIGTERRIYAWRDENGVANFGDDTPDQREKQALALYARSADFVVDINAQNMRLPQHFVGQVEAGGKRIYDQWHQWLGKENLTQSEINIRVLDNAAAFRMIWGREQEALPAGFFRLADNTVYILNEAGQVPSPRLIAVSFHEMSHLIGTWQIGVMPPWFNEGLAEYFETMRVQWQSSSFNADDYWRSRVAETTLVPLRTLLKLRTENWWAGDIRRRYSTAGALFGFLQSSDIGRTTLARVAQDALADRCDENQQKGLKGLSSYPGGIASLERDLRNWIRVR